MEYLINLTQSVPLSYTHIPVLSANHRPCNVHSGIVPYRINFYTQWNKGLGFEHSERDRLGLRGLLPPVVKKIETQVAYVLNHLRNQDGPVAKNLYLQELHNRNETLFHRLLVDYVEEIAPLVYTPTVGTVCQQFGSQYRRTRGMYFSRNDRGHFSSMAYNWPHDDVHVIVVTDGIDNQNPINLLATANIMFYMS